MTAAAHAVVAVFPVVVVVDVVADCGVVVVAVDAADPVDGATAHPSLCALLHFYALYPWLSYCRHGHGGVDWTRHLL